MIWDDSRDGHTSLQLLYSNCEYTATHCNTPQHAATHCNTLQHTATHCDTLEYRLMIWDYTRECTLILHPRVPNDDSVRLCNTNSPCVCRMSAVRRNEVGGSNTKKDRWGLFVPWCASAVQCVAVRANDLHRANEQERERDDCLFESRVFIENW